MQEVYWWYTVTQEFSETETCKQEVKNSFTCENSLLLVVKKWTCSENLAPLLKHGGNWKEYGLGLRMSGCCF